MAVRAYALTALAEAKRHMDITVTTDDGEIEALIDAASDLIEKFCKRRFATQAYTDQLYDGTGDETLFLDNYPVTEVDRVAEGRLRVIGITNTCADATRATVAVGSLGMTLTITGGASLGTDTLTWAVSANLTAVVAATNALTGAAPAKAWAATLSGRATGNYISTELIEAPGRDCLNGTIYLDMPMISGVSDYICHWGEGILERTSGSWASGSRNIIVDYTAGYVTVPSDLQVACNDIVAAMYNRRTRDGALKSEKLGDYSYTLADLQGDIPDTTMATIRRYRDVRL